MMFIPNAAAIRERLAWALAEEDRQAPMRYDLEGAQLVREVVERYLMSSIVEYDPIHLVEVGMRAVIRDIQEWLDGHGGLEAGEVDSKSLQAYLLGALITAGGAEDPLETPQAVAHG